MATNREPVGAPEALEPDLEQLLARKGIAREVLGDAECFYASGAPTGSLFVAIMANLPPYAKALHSAPWARGCCTLLCNAACDRGIRVRALL
jgi:hypothetical protein